MVSNNELLALIPLSGLAIVYWIRDQYLYNKSKNVCLFSNAQLKVLLLYPFWIFSEFARGVQTTEGNYICLMSTLSSFILGHYTTVAIVNDSFYMSRQQIYSIFWGLVIAYTWTGYQLLQFSRDNKVYSVDECNCSCNNTAY